MRIVPTGASHAPLSEIRGDRYRCALKLRCQSIDLMPRELPSQPVDALRKVHSHLPDFQILEVANGIASFVTQRALPDTFSKPKTQNLNDPGTEVIARQIEAALDQLLGLL